MDSPSPSPVSIGGLGALSLLGNDLPAHREHIGRHAPTLRPLGELLGDDYHLAKLPAGWIEPRSLLLDRKWAPLTVAALRVAREAISDAGWTAAMLDDAALVVATSRGNAAGWLAPWPGRRPFRVMAASNSMTAEPGTAIGIELGIHGPCHVISTGCSAGLDALGIANLLLTSGTASRALVVAVDLPLVPCLLDAYHQSGMLSTNGLNDPYAPTTSGLLPAEGAAAIALEADPRPGQPLLLGHLANSDASNPIGIPADGGRLTELLDSGRKRFGRPAAISPHASGTPTLATAEPTAITRTFPDAPPLVILKPYVGHSISAAALIESVILADALRAGRLPSSPAGLTPPAGMAIASSSTPPHGPVFKVASGLGGHNSLVVLAPPRG